jgi:hypothetical protein
MAQPGSMAVRLKIEELPLALLSRACPADLAERRHCVTVAGRRLELTTGGEPGQLPTAGDMAVLLALVFLYRQRSEDVRELEFTIYELGRALGQMPSGRLYARLKTSLDMWTKASYRFEARDLAAGAGKPYETTFRVLESCSWLPDKRVLSKWSDPVWFALMHGAWSALDAKVLFDLSPLSRQLYCLLVSRFRSTTAPQTFDLHELAFQHLGISKEMPNRRLLGQMRQACADLERDYLKPTEERIRKRQAGSWDVVFENPTYSSAS